MTFDLKISNGTVANSFETFEADVAVKDGRIVAVGRGLGDAEREIDAAGKYVLPGGIEAHCHIEQESSSGLMTSDDYYSGSVSAAQRGVRGVTAVRYPEACDNSCGWHAVDLERRTGASISRSARTRGAYRRACV